MATIPFIAVILFLDIASLALNKHHLLTYLISLFVYLKFKFKRGKSAHSVPFRCVRMGWRPPKINKYDFKIS